MNLPSMKRFVPLLLAACAVIATQTRVQAQTGTVSASARAYADTLESLLYENYPEITGRDACLVLALVGAIPPSGTFPNSYPRLFPNCARKYLYGDKTLYPAFQRELSLGYENSRLLRIAQQLENQTRSRLDR
jgi:hypothetical protein